MTKKIIQITLFGFIGLIIVLNSCRKEVYVVGSGTTALEYAYECEAVCTKIVYGYQKER